VEYHSITTGAGVLLRPLQHLNGAAAVFVARPKCWRQDVGKEALVILERTPTRRRPRNPFRARRAVGSGYVDAAAPPSAVIACHGYVGAAVAQACYVRAQWNFDSVSHWVMPLTS